ncbi:MAG: DUF4855 domain-containing protein [Verrucomicrobia bacterium]|nr:DUF4855 domain-containing protein [Verrucomicrobiota bacterium]
MKLFCWLNPSLLLAFALVGSALPALPLPAADAPPAAGYLPLASARAAGIADLVLIYQGGTHRLPWTSDQLAPYVSFTDPASGREEWLFDGFLFIEFKDGRGHEFARGYKQQSARQEDWQWLLDRAFERDRAIDALDQAIARAVKRGGAPARPRSVVLTLPEPIYEQKDWGALGGRPLDFAQPDDRVAACAWYVKTALARWQALAPRHLTLAGFYWVAENAHHADEILPRIAADVHRSGQRFFWIPYWQAAGAAKWSELGFDAAYQQPNHFFNAKVADARLDAACAFARTRGLGLEFECDARAITSPDVFRPRLESYLGAFERQGVRTAAAMAYYEGGSGLLQMAQSQDPAVSALYHRVARWVATRQRQADAAPTAAPERP